MKKEDDVINVWEKVIEITEDGEVVGYYFQYKRRMKKQQQEVKDDDESGSTDGKERD